MARNGFKEVYIYTALMLKEKAQGIIRLPATFLRETESIDVALRWKEVCLSIPGIYRPAICQSCQHYIEQECSATAEWLVQKWMLDFRAAASRAFSPCSARAPALPGCAWLVAIPCTSVVVVLPAKSLAWQCLLGSLSYFLALFWASASFLASMYSLHAWRPGSRKPRKLGSMHLEHPLVLPLHRMQPKVSTGLAVLASLCSCLMAGAAAGRLIAAAGRFWIVLLLGLAWSFLPCFLPLWSWLKASCSKSSRVLSCHDTSFSPCVPLEQTVRKQHVSCLASCSLASLASAASPAALVSSVVTGVAGEGTCGSHGKTWFAGGFAGPAWFGSCWAWPCLAFKCSSSSSNVMAACGVAGGRLPLHLLPFLADKEAWVLRKGTLSSYVSVQKLKTENQLDASRGPFSTMVPGRAPGPLASRWGKLCGAKLLPSRGGWPGRSLLPGKWLLAKPGIPQ